MYQDTVYDSDNDMFLGILQGYSFIFDTNNTFNTNNIPFLENGTIDVIDDNYIFSAMGSYENYGRGSLIWTDIQMDPYIAEITFLEPIEEVKEDSFEDNDEEMTFRLTSEGGMYETIYDGDKGKKIGEIFQNAMTVSASNTTRISTNQGYVFFFPPITYMIPNDTNSYQWNRNCQFILDDDKKMIAFNEVIIYATGKYKKFIQGGFNEVIVLSDPNFISDIILTTAAAAGNEDNPYQDYNNDNDEYDFSLIMDFADTTEDEYYQPIIDVTTGEQIGELFQNPFMNPKGKKNRNRSRLFIQLSNQQSNSH